MESQATKTAVNAEKITHLEEELEELRNRVDELSAERNSALKWGVIVLGSTVVGLFTWIVNYFAEHAK